MKDFLKQCLKLNALYEVKYSDYEENQWTVPVKLTEDRLNKVLDDHSVAGLRITFLEKLL